MCLSETNVFLGKKIDEENNFLDLYSLVSRRHFKRNKLPKKFRFDEKRTKSEIRKNKMIHRKSFRTEKIYCEIKWFGTIRWFYSECSDRVKKFRELVEDI